jgi:hypothetical protein
MVARIIAWSNGTTTAVFVPGTQTIDVGEYSELRIAMEPDNFSDAANTEVARAVSYSNDGISWSSGTALGSYTSSTGWDYGTAFATFDVSKRFARLGVMVKRPAGSGDNASVSVNLNINLKPR